MKRISKTLAIIRPCALAVAVCLLVACPKVVTINGAITLSPSSLDFGRSTREASLTLAKADSQVPAVGFAVQSDEPWLTVMPDSGTLSDTSTIPLTVTVTRAFMTPGGNTGQLTVLVDETEVGAVSVRAENILAADFIAAYTDVLVGEPVLFNDISRVLTGADPITQWKWDFGDGAGSTQQNPVHAYTKPGKQTVTLTVQSASLTDTRIRRAYIHAKKPVAPRADFAAASRTPMVGVPMQFSDLSFEGTSPLTEWWWDFGDGGWSRLQNPVHIYTAAAVYDVFLTVTAPEGDDTEIKLGYVDVKPAPPIAAFAASRQMPFQGESVIFSDLSIARGAPVVEWLWDFGDGATSTEQNPRHAYESAGRYTVTLTVHASSGSDAERKSDYVVVQAKPEQSSSPQKPSA